jgi:hypothetical protein
MSVNRSPSRRKPRRPATTDEGRENQLISLASDLAERQLTDGSASSAVITHYLKLGSTREKLEQSRIENENLLLAAKVDQLASAKKVEELYAAALGAMKQYAGRDDDEFEDDEEGIE